MRIAVFAEGDKAEQAKEAGADIVGLEDLAELSGSLTVSWRNDEVVVEGKLSAQATQACIVTLEPVDEKIDDDFRVIFAQRPDEAPDHEPAGEDYAEPQELVEPLEGDSIDLGEVLAQQFALSLNPYPRAEGAELPEEGFTADAADNDEEGGESANPFAVLKQLKSND